MHKKSTTYRHYLRGEIMEKKQKRPVPQELRDQPVPPVKGAVTDLQDAVLRPEGSIRQERAVQLEDSSIFGSWL